MKRIKRPVYEEVLECECCGNQWPTNVRYPAYSAGFAKCCICKKEGCTKCITWRGLDGKKYIYHANCKKKLPASILKAWREIDQMNDDRQEAHDREYGRDHIC